MIQHGEQSGAVADPSPLQMVYFSAAAVAARIHRLGSQSPTQHPGQGLALWVQ